MRWLTCALMLLCVALVIAVWRVSEALVASMDRLTVAAEQTTATARETLEDAQTTMKRVRNLAYDVHKNWTDNAALQTRALSTLERTTRATESALSRCAASVETLAGEAASTIAEARERIVPATEEAIHEVSNAAAGIPPVLEEARATVAATHQAIDGIGAETQATIAEVRPVLQSTDAVMRSGGGIAEAIHKVMDHYEQLITHPTWKQRAKGYFQMILSAFNLWGNAKLLF